MTTHRSKPFHDDTSQPDLFPNKLWVAEFLIPPSRDSHPLSWWCHPIQILIYVLYTVSLQNTPSIHHLNLILRLKLHEIELKLQFRCLFRSERGLSMSTRKRYTYTMNIHFPFLSIELLEITDVSNFKYTRDSTIVNYKVLYFTH